MKNHATLALFACLLLPVSSALADTFGTGANTFEIEFVPIGNPGNPADTTGDPNPAGKVDYVYRMGKFEVSREMFTKANNDGRLDIEMDPRDHPPEFPATGVTWFDAARFVNWLNTSKGHSPAYKFDEEGNFQLWQPQDPGYDPDNLFRNRQARYVLPSTDEWYKAAYYDPVAEVYYEYPTGSDSIPANGIGTDSNTAVHSGGEAAPPNLDIMRAGGLSPYETMGQGGNVWEWEETKFDFFGRSFRGIRGGGWESNPLLMGSSIRGYGDPSTTGIDTAASFATGFRVVSIPEPSSLLITAIASAAFLLYKQPRW